MLTRIKLYAAGFGAFMVALAAAYWRGWSRAQKDAEHEQMENYIETRKRMDEIGRMSDADTAREWLRERGKSGSDM